MDVQKTLCIVWVYKMFPAFSSIQLYLTPPCLLGLLNRYHLVQVNDVYHSFSDYCFFIQYSWAKFTVSCYFYNRKQCNSLLSSFLLIITAEEGGLLCVKIYFIIYRYFLIGIAALSYSSNSYINIIKNIQHYQLKRLIKQDLLQFKWHISTSPGIVNHISHYMMEFWDISH